MRRTPLLGAASVCLLLVGTACSADDPTEAEVEDDISAALRSGDEALTEEEAGCWAAIVVEEVGLDELNDMNVSDDEPTPELEEAIATGAVRAEDECFTEG
jgi:hypothetical protein